MLRIIFKIHVFLNFEIWNPHNYLHSFIDPYLKKKKLIFLDFHKNIGFLKSICCVGVFIHTRWPHNTENLSQNIVYKPRFEASKWYWCFYPRCDWCPWLGWLLFFRKCGVIQCGLGEVSTAHKKNLSHFYISKKL